MSALRVVLDTNVVISAFLFGGHPATLLRRALDGSMACFTSLVLLDEIRDVLLRPKFGLSPAQALTFVEEFRAICHIVTPNERVSKVIADPDDDAVLECAISAAADLVVSGDVHLLGIGRWRGIRMLNPAQAVIEICGEQGEG